MVLNPKGRDWGNLVNWDDLGKAYAGFIIAWTVILYLGVLWLLQNRNLPFIKIRNLPLAITSTSFLHIYLVKICLAYTTNGHFLCSAEFWIMSIYLPFGIALFQANLAQLRSVSDQQQKLVSSQHLNPVDGATSPLKRARSLWDRWNSLARIQKTYVVIGLGMLVQIVITAILYATTPTLHGDWRSFGHVTYAKGQAKCRKSYQWIPSAFWQLIWAWFYGPYTLYSIRKIHDVHYWRLQIILSVLSGLPGTPLWLAALYSLKFKPVNKWFVPPMWLAPGIIVMQFVTVFFPIFEAYRGRSQMRTTMSIIKDWEDKRGAANSDDRLISGSTSQASYDKSANYTSMTSSRRSKDIYTMASLEKALTINPVPLLQFAATRDFTAENILFLMQVRRWRSAWVVASRNNPQNMSHEARSQLFNAAVEIYVSSVNERTTEFPINIESAIRSNLDNVFSGAVPEGRYMPDSSFNPFSALPISPRPSGHTRRRSTSSSSATADVAHVLPWDAIDKKPSVTTTITTVPMSTLSSSSSAMPSSPALETALDEERLFEPHPAVAPLGKARATIRDGFDEHVFDAAEKSIKYLVLTNTWQKFVKSGEDSYNLREAANAA